MKAKSSYVLNKDYPIHPHAQDLDSDNTDPSTRASTYEYKILSALTF